MKAAAFSESWWHDLLIPASWSEVAIRPLLIYVALLVVFRIASKRELAQATLFDFLIVLLIANVVQNAMIGGDSSIFGAVVGAVLLVLASSLLGRLTARSRKARVLLEGRAAVLVRNGVIDEAMMDHQQVSRNDLLSSIRKQGIARLCDVAYAILELDGSISVIQVDADPRPLDCLPSEVACLHDPSVRRRARRRLLHHYLPRRRQDH